MMVISNHNNGDYNWPCERRFLNKNVCSHTLHTHAQLLAIHCIYFSALEYPASTRGAVRLAVASLREH